jgi:hypothetical protein
VTFCDARLEMILKGQMWLRSTRLSLHMLLVPTGPKYCLFCPWQVVSKINDILWCATLKWRWKVKCDSGPPDIQYTCYLCPLGPNFAYFCSMTSRFRDKWHFMMRDLKMSNVTQVHQTPITHATYTHRAQILLIFALRQAVSDINNILWCTTLKGQM